MENKITTIKYIFIVAIVLMMGRSSSFATLYTGQLSTESNGSLEAGSVTMQVSQTNATTWHCQYTFQNEDKDVFNFGSDVSSLNIDICEPSSSNSGFTTDETISDVKLDMSDALLSVEFNSNHKTMWRDFYSKANSNKNIDYNADLGVIVADPQVLVNSNIETSIASSNALAKVLVPNTVPEPATHTILGLDGLTLLSTNY